MLPLVLLLSVASCLEPPAVVIESPLHGSDVAGDTRIAVVATGLPEVIMRCWGAGEDRTIGRVELDATGRGSIVFPADSFPHGPLTIRIAGPEPKPGRMWCFQVYNTGGTPAVVPPADLPKGAAGLKPVFTDTFEGPLSIAKDGGGAKYAAHKPGGGDFSGIPFGDHEDAEKSPFACRDSLLRIRADEKKNTTGLISSLRMDGTGFTVEVPCYFECRFVGPSAPGTWPAFWIMTQDVHRGLKEPADELDVVEAYGGSGPGQPNQRGYWINAHYWNQGPDGGKDTAQPGFSGMIEMDKAGGGSSWFETFHTYGVRVDETNTVYYCDNVEVARHPTARLSRSRPLFFMVNLAIGGTSGWKKDLSGTGGIADMYVDFVRVYAK